MKRKIFIRISYIFLLIFMWILFAFNTYNSDYEGYSFFYDYFAFHKSYPGIEIGFSSIMRLCNYFGLSFQQFLMVYSGIGVILIGKFIWNYSNRPILVMGLYFLYPYIFGITQIRNFLAACILLVALTFLYKDDGKSLLIYFGLILLASTFHIASMFYLIFYLARLDVKKIKRIIAFLLMGGAAMTLIALNNPKLLSFISPKLLIYFSHSTRLETKIFFLIFYVCVVFLTDYLVKTINERKLKTDIDNFSLFCCKINYLSCILYPFFWISMDFERLEYNIIVLFYISAINVFFLNKRLKERPAYVISFIELFFYVLIFIVIYFLVFKFSYESTVKVIFENNSLFR